MSLFYKLLLSFLIAIIVPTSFIGIVSYQKFSSAIESEVSNSVNNIIVQTNMNLHTHIEHAFELSNIVYINPKVQQVLNIQSAVTWNELMGDVGELRDILANITTYEKLYKIRLYYHDTEQFPDGFESVELQSLSKLERSPVVAQAMNSQRGMVWTGEQLQPSNGSSENEITLIRAIRSLNDERQIIGAMRISILERRIWDIIEPVRMGKTGFAFIVSNEGKLISHHDKSLLGQDLSMKPYFSKLASEASGSFMTDLNGTSTMFVYQTITGTDWKLVGFVNASELHSGIYDIQIAVIFISLVCYGLAALFSIYMSSWLAKRIGSLMKAMRKIESGELGTQIHIRKDKMDELTQLYQHFNRMSKELKQNMEMIETTSANIRKAELKALQNQINPHFLYNTLDSINWMAATKYRAMDISVMVTSLANVFRLGLNQSKELTTVALELEHVRCYVVIQQIRFNNEFTMEVEAGSEVLQLPMVKLLVQPLVENSIIHGFEDINYPGHILIRAYVRELNLYIEVIDNGKGCDVEGLNRMLEEEDSAGKNRMGYGLHNVNERIKLYYGSKYGLQYQGRPDGEAGLIARLDLPAQPSARGETND